MLLTGIRIDLWVILCQRLVSCCSSCVLTILGVCDNSTLPILKFRDNNVFVMFGVCDNELVTFCLRKV